MEKTAEFPKHIIIEITNVCNLNCIMCPAHSKKAGLNRQKGFIGINLYKKIVDETANFKNVKLSSIGAGEPLLHPKLVDMLNYAYRKGVMNSIITNATLLSNRISKELIKSGLTSIGFSIDGSTPAEFNMIRKGADYNLVFKNIMDFLVIKKMFSSSPFTAVLRVCFDEKKEGLDTFINTWLRYVDKVELIQKRTLTSRQIGKKPAINNSRQPCINLWEHIVIMWDGKVALCCEDWNCEVIVGDITKQSIWEIWNSGMEKMRRLHSQHKWNEIIICQDCDMWMASQKTVSQEDNIQITHTPAVSTYVKLV